MSSQQPVLYIAGDIHLKGGPSVFDRWLDRLGQRTPARLVILGDLFEYWLDTDDAVARYRDVLSRLKGLKAAGWRLDLVMGNRELAAGRRLEVESGCAVHWPHVDIELGGRTVRIVHGDRLVHDPHYRFFSAWLRSFWHRLWQSCHPAFVEDAVARFLRRRSQARQRDPVKRAHIFIDRRRVQAAARGADTLVAGHIHESWRRKIGGIDMMLVGDWPESTGQWIEGYGDGRLERRRDEFG
jgi:UDP-2,3-diacylglucosamine hydrolase